MGRSNNPGFRRPALYIRLACAVILSALACSCGGASDDDERVLHLPGQTLTESELRSLWLSQIEQAPGAAAVICREIAGSEPDEVLAFFAVNPPSGTDQPPNQDDMLRAAEILQDECASRLEGAGS